MDPSERIFVYLRVKTGDEVVSRSKVRELRALGALLAELMADTAAGAVPGILDPDAEIRVEYVDASTDEALVGFSADREREELVVSGKIPPRYRSRMLGPNAEPGITREELERRAAAKLGEEAARELADGVFRSELDLMGLIERAIDGDGKFLVRVPMGKL